MHSLAASPHSRRAPCGTRDSPASQGGINDQSLDDLLLSEPCRSGNEAGLGAVGDLELREDGGHIVADGLLAEEEGRRDLGVRLPLGEKLQDLELPVGELRKGQARVERRRRREKPL